MNKLEKIEHIRHSSAHVLAMAVLKLFPEAKLGVGPVIENGFYYDFDLPRAITADDFPALEKIMKEVIAADHAFECQQVSADEAREFFEKAGQTYKVELINDLAEKGEAITLYKSGSFTDLCAGPHVKSTGEINPEALKLTRVSGAYWKSSEENQQLQRVYGVAFEKAEELEDYLKQLEEAEKWDHKKLGREMDLFSFHGEAPGSVFWHPKGMVIWNELERLGKSLRKKYGSQEIQTPQLAKSILWKTSGHWDHYHDSMFVFEQGDDTYCIKPMDCPFNIKIYQTKQRSYKELPIRYSEIGRVMRNEKSGELNGLLRVRSITQDDAHIFATPAQVEDEIVSLLKMVKEYYQIFKMNPEFFLSTRPDDFMGEIADWDQAEVSLKSALGKESIPYALKEKDGAFYGPKIDINIKDALGRSWQLATIQLDFQLPQRFNLEYVDDKGQRQVPVMIHAAIFGSFERFIGILLEHTGGELPVWLSPVQAVVLSVSEQKFGVYAQEVGDKMLAAGIRVEVDNGHDNLGKRIRNAEMQKIPYILVVGQKEADAKGVAVRSRSQGDEGLVGLDELIAKVSQEIAEKK